MTSPSVTEVPARTPEWLREERARAHRLAAHYELQGRPFISSAMTAYALDLLRELEAHRA